MTLKEEPFSLPTPDGKTIYGVLTHAEKTTDKVFIIAHCLTGSIDIPHQLSARDLFIKKGYNVVRFNFYGPEENARTMHDTTLQIHADDLNLVCNHFRPTYKKLYISGHSYGGLALLIANPKANAISFWDSTYIPFDLHWSRYTKVEGTSYYASGEHPPYFGEAMYLEAKALTRDKVHAYTKRIKTPSHVVLAGDNTENDPRNELFTTLTCEKELNDVKGADHFFSTNNTVDTLLQTTLAWFDKH